VKLDLVSKDAIAEITANLGNIVEQLCLRAAGQRFGGTEGLKVQRAAVADLKHEKLLLA